MPYKNIHWIKLEKRLLNDYRFYTLSEEAQLIYVKFLMLAAETSNKMPKNTALLKQVFRTTINEATIEQSIVEIKRNFPKFKENNRFYYFSEWSNRCNFVTAKEILRKSQENPTDGTDNIRIDKTTLDKIRLEYLKVMGYQEKNLQSDDYARIHKGIKALLIKSSGNVEMAIAAIHWVAGRGYDWTIETVVKKYIDFITTKEAKDKLAELLKGIGKPVA